MVDLYSYTKSWAIKSHGLSIESELRKTYLIKSLLLILFLPIDVFLYFFVNLLGKKKKANLILLTGKWMELNYVFAKKTSVAHIGLAKYITYFFKNKCLFMLVSPVYIFSTVGLFLPEKYKNYIGNFVISIAKAQLSKCSTSNSKVIVHSDALPFSRAYVMAANQLGLNTVCIQHGTFYGVHKILERDGFLCGSNIVRSATDASIILEANSKTSIHIATDFFVPKLFRSTKLSSGHIKILLLGEGLHVTERDFGIKYMATLKSLYAHYQAMDIDVAFRPHPSERGFFRRNNFNHIDSLALADSLSIVDAIVGFSSSLLLEAAQVGIPSFHIAVDGFSAFGLNRDGVVVKFMNNPEEVILAAQKYHSERIYPVTDSVENSSVNELAEYIMSINLLERSTC